jgi:carboxypeptidase Q
MSHRSVALLAVVVGCAPQPRVAPPVAPAQTPGWIADTSLAPTQPVAAAAPVANLAAPYREAADRILRTARADRGAYTKLAHLTDRIGARLAGSPQLDQAIAWAQAAMRADGHDVRAEPVQVPVWIRGHEEGAIVSPVARPITLIGIGDTVPTPKGGITAPIVVVHSFDELDAKGAAVKGKLVLFDVAMPPYSETTGSGYGEVVRYRGLGPSRAAKLGAVGVLVRSVTAHSLGAPHTGALRYDPAAPKIPAAAVTVEDAALITRLAAAGPVTVRLVLESRRLPDAPSANVIGELRGRERPEEIVLISAHLDSWDVGQGAHDDGAGCVMVMQALTTLRKLGLVPRRTIRVVLFTNEENGLRGGKQYAIDHAAEAKRTVLAFETDSGGFSPRGFTVDTEHPTAGTPRVIARLTELLTLLAPINVTRVIPGHGGSDISPLAALGVPALGLAVDGRTYFDIHHTKADTLDKVDPQALADGVAAVAVLAYVAAELPGRLDD